HALAREAVVPAPAGLQALLHLVDTKRAADGHERVHGGAAEALEAIVGNQTTHAVGDHDVGPGPVRARRQGRLHSLPDLVAHAIGTARARAVGAVEQVVM